MNKTPYNDIIINAFRVSAIGMALVSLDGKLLKVNSAFCRILEYSPAELEQLTFQEITHPDDLELNLTNLNGLLHEKTEYCVIEKRYFKKNGSIVWVLLSVSLVRDENNKPLYYVSQFQDITEHKKLKEQLEKSEERYRALVESSPNGIVVHQEGKIVYANPRFIHFIKASSEEELIGRHILRFVHPDFHQIVKERIDHLEKNEDVGLQEEKYVLLDGSIVDVEVIATPIEYMNKPAFQVIIQDISKRKEMERELNYSQELYRSVIANVKEIIFHTDVEGIWTFLNPAWEEMTGYSIKESLGTYFHAYLYPNDRESINKQFESLVLGKQEYYRKEVRFLTRDGKYRWVEVFARVTVNDQGKIIGTLGTMNDITKRKESEDELKASEERFRLLAEYSSDLITMHDAAGKYLYVSPACKEILQYDAKDLVGRDAFLDIHPDDLEAVKNKHRTLLDTGYSVVTYRIRRKDGEYVWFESAIKLISARVTGEQKEIVVSRNISERKLVEQRLKEANELLRHLSTIDGLTGVSNRRTFDKQVEIEWNRALRNSTPLSLIMLDIDYFKAYNDTYGHQGGDGCLKQVAAVIEETLGRSTDLLCRYGGEEFCVILPETNEAGAIIVGERIRCAIESLKIPHSGSKILPWLTISAGTATTIPSVYTSYVDLIANADKAVYKAKFDGRNCVRSYQ
jgi:diguanylate cyclase (GGDEF)-like protein/PAS domain S-box-containing protein